MKRLVHFLALYAALIAIAALIGCEKPKPPVKPAPVKPVTQLVVYDFHATWCNPCKIQAPIVDAVEDSGVKVVRVDIDKQPELAAKYGVESVPTYVIVTRGVETFRTQNANVLYRKLVPSKRWQRL